MTDFINFIGAIISFLVVLDLDKKQLYAVCLKSFSPLKYNLYLEKPIAFRYGFV